MTLYFVAGEASGDNHGAELMSSLRQCDADLNFLGRGGPQMKAIAGEQFANWIDDVAIVGLWEVIKNYGFFREKFRETLAEIERSKPDAVVLISVGCRACCVLWVLLLLWRGWVRCVRPSQGRCGGPVGGREWGVGVCCVAGAG